MAMSPSANPLSAYDWEILEQFGNQEISIQSGHLITEPAPWKVNKDNIKFWRDYCKEKKRGYVIAAGFLKAELRDKYINDQKVGRVRHAIHHPRSNKATLENLCDQTGFDIDFVRAALAKMLDYKQIERIIIDNLEHFVPRTDTTKYLRPKLDPTTGEPVIDPTTGEPVMYDTSAVSKKFKNKPFPYYADEEVYVLLRHREDFSWCEG